MGVPDTPEVWGQLDRVLDKTYKFANGRGLKIARTFIDCGGHYADYVYAYCFKNCFRQRFAIKGSNMVTKTLLPRLAKSRCVTAPFLWCSSARIRASSKSWVANVSIEVQGAKYMHFPLDDKHRMKKFVEALQGLLKMTIRA